MIARLYVIADDHWPLIDAHYSNINLIQMPMHRFLNCIYTWVIERIGPDKRDMFETMLREPLEGQAPSQATEEEEGMAFMAAMQAFKN